MTNYLATKPPDECTCDEETSLTRDITFDVSPAAGGGWPVWSQALSNLLTRLSLEPAHCVIITQEPNMRYVQLVIGHGLAHVEAVSNAYLIGDFRLDSGEESRLRQLGFQSPDEAGDDWEGPENWWINYEHFDPTEIGDLLTQTLMNVMTFTARRPINIHIFGAVSPCKACF